MIRINEKLTSVEVCFLLFKVDWTLLTMAAGVSFPARLLPGLLLLAFARVFGVSYKNTNKQSKT